MARLVPAKIKVGSEGVKKAILAFESGLDDDWMIFQGRAFAGEEPGKRVDFVLMHPDNGVHCVAVVEGDLVWDVDLEEFVQGDEEVEISIPVEEFVSANPNAIPSGMSVHALTVLSDSDAQGRPGVIGKSDLLAPESLLSAVSRGGSSVQDEEMTSALAELTSQEVAKQSPYARGFVTPVQRKWRTAKRAEELQQSFGESPAAVAPDPVAMEAQPRHDTDSREIADSTAPSGVADTASGAPDAEAVPAVTVEGQTYVVGEESQDDFSDVEDELTFPDSDDVLEFPEPTEEQKSAWKQAKPAGNAPRGIDPTVQRMLELCVESAAGDRPIYVADVEVQPKDVASEQFILPAVLIVAAEAWTIVAAAKGKGGFHISLKYDPDALLGWKVDGLKPSAPFSLFVPVTSLIRGAAIGNEINLDKVVSKFERWLKTHGFPADLIQDVDVRVATSI